LFEDFSNDEPGGIILVKKGDKLVYQHAFGIADINTKEPIDVHTILNTGSISKTFVAYGILILEEMGLLSIEDEIGKYFPDFENKEIANQVKVKHLLSHSSGLPDIRNVRGNQEFFMTAKDAGNFNPIKKADKLKFQPGEKFEYSNPAFNGLALIIEKVSGKKWQDFIKEEIFIPSGMDESYITDGQYPDSGVAHAYYQYGDEWREYDYGEFPTFTAAGNGGVWCSISDLLKYESAIQHNVFLSQEGIDKSRSILESENWISTESSSRMGLSWFISAKDNPQNISGKDIIYHTGSQGGFRAFHISIPEEKILYVALFNRPVDYSTTLFKAGIEIIKANNWYNED